jgi:hypothetical protein
MTADIRSYFVVVAKMGQNMSRKARTVLCQAARELLDIYERHPETWSRLMGLVTELDLELLHDLARDPLSGPPDALRRK